jgi:hypothetical protein
MTTSQTREQFDKYGVVNLNSSDLGGLPRFYPMLAKGLQDVLKQFGKQIPSKVEEFKTAQIHGLESDESGNPVRIDYTLPDGKTKMTGYNLMQALADKSTKLKGKDLTEFDKTWAKFVLSSYVNTTLKFDRKSDNPIPMSEFAPLVIAWVETHDLLYKFALEHTDIYKESGDKGVTVSEVLTKAIEI